MFGIKTNHRQEVVCMVTPQELMHAVEAINKRLPEYLEPKYGTRLWLYLLEEQPEDQPIVVWEVGSAGSRITLDTMTFGRIQSLDSTKLEDFLIERLAISLLYLGNALRLGAHDLTEGWLVDTHPDVHEKHRQRTGVGSLLEGVPKLHGKED